MSAGTDMSATRRLADYFGDLGPRWGLPADACRVHAWLYVACRPAPVPEIAAALGLAAEAAAAALDFLRDHGLAAEASPGRWRTSSDPWEMLVGGLEERRRRELPEALLTLRACLREAVATDGDPMAARQIGKLIDLVETLAALGAGMGRISPRLVRGLLGASGRTRRLLGRALATRKDDAP